MSNIVVVGGGFGGIVAAESLAKRLGDEHEITLVSRSRTFLFYPALVRLAFGECEQDDIGSMCARLCMIAKSTSLMAKWPEFITPNATLRLLMAILL